MKFKNSKKFKAEIITGFIAVILLISIVGVQSLTRTITDDSDTVYTRITNSKGGVWEVNESNLALAIADQGEAGLVSVGANLTLTSPIYLRCTQTGGNPDPIHSLILDFQGHTVTLGADCEFINLTGVKYSTVKNVRVVPYSGHENTSIIKLHANNIYSEGIDWSYRVDYNTFENIQIINNAASYNFTGINLSIESGENSRIDTNVFNDMIIYGCNVGIKLFCDDKDGYINGNKFENIYIDQFVDGVWFDTINANEAGGAVNDVNENTFINIKGQATGRSVYGLKNISGTANIFRDILWWDWSVATSPQYQYWIGKESVTTSVEIHNVLATDSYFDEGLGSIIHMANREIQYDSDYDYMFTKDGTYYYTRLGEFGDMPVSGSYDRNIDFESLIKAAAANDDILIKLGNGTFIPDQKIAIAGKNITIEGRDDHTTIIKGESGTQYASGLFQMIDAGVANITFRNIVFNGNDVSDSSVGLYFGFNENLHGLTVENCIFINWNVGTSRGVFVSPNTDDVISNVKIIDCEFYKCDYGVTLEGDSDPSLVQYADVSHNYFMNCQFSIFCDWVRNSTISNNRIISTIASSDGITLDDSIDIIVDGNLVIVVDDGVIEGTGADYNMIYGNNLRSSGDPLTTVGGNTNATLNIV